MHYSLLFHEIDCQEQLCCEKSNFSFGQLLLRSYYISQRPAINILQHYFHIDGRLVNLLNMYNRTTFSEIPLNADLVHELQNLTCPVKGRLTYNFHSILLAAL